MVIRSRYTVRNVFRPPVIGCSVGVVVGAIDQIPLPSQNPIKVHTPRIRNPVRTIKTSRLSNGILRLHFAFVGPASHAEQNPSVPKLNHAQVLLSMLQVV
jgi:hypothetical protein